MFFDKNPAFPRFSPRHLSSPGFTTQDFGVHFKKAGGFIEI
jgi:hypothetical protein